MQTEVGYVIENHQFLVYLDGFPTIRINDMVENENGQRGWVTSLSETKVEVLMFDEGKIIPGQIFKKSPNRLGVPAGDFLLGRAINPLGVPIDGRGLLSKTKAAKVLELEQAAGGIRYRKFIKEQFLTGVTLIDSLIPLGRGQRELIIGDAHSGKTMFLIDLIMNQRDKGVICIYASIGKPVVSVRDLLNILRANKALPYTMVIAASSTEPAPLIFLTPKTAFTLAEYFQKQGKNVLVILDDLGIHAKVYREMSLLGNKPPGRESYPGDIFYQHAHLLERAGNFREEYGGGSITALPVIELTLTDFTTFIPTNLMSMTDGHLLFKSSLHNLGMRPAIDISLSVTRVGKQTQDRLTNMLSTTVRQLLSHAEELETISSFSAELPPQTQIILRQKQILEEVLKQEPLTSVPKEIQLIMLALCLTPFVSDKDKNFMEKYKKILWQAFLEHPELTRITKSVPLLKTDNELIKILEQTAPILSKICS